MLTANFYTGMAAWLIGKSMSGGKNRNGEETTIQKGLLADSGSGIKPAMLNPVSSYYSTANYGVVFGSGTTPPTVNDYKLESTISDTLTFTKPSAVTLNETDDYWEMSATYGISTSSDKTISEVGVFVTYNGTTDISKSVMIDRTVLENPIVIPAGQSKQVTYTIRLNKPK